MKVALISIVLAFIVLVFPIYVNNYVYLNSEERYASINVCLYRYFRVLNINTVKNSLDKMQINGKEEKFSGRLIKKNVFKIFKSLPIIKVIQLTDCGVTAENNLYFALLQNNFTQILYSFIQRNGKRAKLRNYVVFNYEHGNINYYMKISSVINVLVLLKIAIILLTEKLYELKTQKKKGKRI